MLYRWGRVSDFHILDREIRVSFDLEYLGRRTSYCEKNYCAEIYYQVLRLTDFLVSYGLWVRR